MQPSRAQWFPHDLCHNRSRIPYQVHGDCLLPRCFIHDASIVAQDVYSSKCIYSCLKGSLTRNGCSDQWVNWVALPKSQLTSFINFLSLLLTLEICRVKNAVSENIAFSSFKLEYLTHLLPSVNTLVQLVADYPLTPPLIPHCSSGTAPFLFHTGSAGTGLDFCLWCLWSPREPPARAGGPSETHACNFMRHFSVACSASSSATDYCRSLMWCKITSREFRMPWRRKPFSKLSPVWI